MALRDVFQKYFTDTAETKENHGDEDLVTHYYKTTDDKAFKALSDHFESHGDYKLHASSKEHKEISLQSSKNSKAFIVMTIIMVEPYRTAIDLNVTMNAAIGADFGKSHQVIKALYAEIDKVLKRYE